MKLFVGALMGLALSGAAAAQTEQPVTPVAATPAAPEKKICWRDQVTGSMMPSVRICMTRAERRAWLGKMQGNVNALLEKRQRAPGGGDTQ